MMSARPIYSHFTYDVTVHVAFICVAILVGKGVSMFAHHRMIKKCKKSLEQNNSNSFVHVTKDDYQRTSEYHKQIVT